MCVNSLIIMGCRLFDVQPLPVHALSNKSLGTKCGAIWINKHIFLPTKCNGKCQRQLFIPNRDMARAGWFIIMISGHLHPGYQYHTSCPWGMLDWIINEQIIALTRLFSVGIYQILFSRYHSLWHPSTAWWGLRQCIYRYNLYTHTHIYLCIYIYIQLICVFFNECIYIYNWCLVYTYIYLVSE